MKMKTTIVLHDVYCDVTYPEYLHVRNRYYKNPTWVILRQLRHVYYSICDGKKFALFGVYFNVFYKFFNEINTI
jgi:hypothetical protein